MKYQEGLEKTKNFLRTNPEPKIRDVCEKAGLTEKETEIIVLKFRKGKSRLWSSDKVHISESRLSIKTTAILRILKVILIQLGFIDGDE